MLRISTPLSDQIENVIHRVIGCCITVHKELGPGLLEGVYCRALCVEFAIDGLVFEAEKQFVVTYRGEPLCHQRVDFVIEGSVLLEVKAIDRLVPIHKAQVISYLRVSHLRAGLLVNFNAVTISDGLQRIVL